MELDSYASTDPARPTAQPRTINTCADQSVCMQTYWIWLGVGWCVIGWTIFNLGTWLFHAYLDRALCRPHPPHRLTLLDSVFSRIWQSTLYVTLTWCVVVRYIPR